MSPVGGHRRKITEADFSSADLISGHYGSTPFKFSNTIFTVVREPTELSFSYIKYLSPLSDIGLFNEELLKRYLYEEKLRLAVTNVISKSICLSTDLDRYNANIDNHLYMAHNSWCLEDKKYNADSALSSITDNDIKVFLYGHESLYSDIASFLDVEITETPLVRINASIDIEKDLYYRYYDELMLANAVDVDLYERLKL